MEHLKLTFGDIMQPKILYYDPSVEAACFDICNHFKIQTMPGISGDAYYEMIGDSFHQKPILAENMVGIRDCIFSKDVLVTFERNNHNILFVFDEGMLSGVVHICDYNRDIVLQCIQDDMLSFERQLRQLITLHGYTNTDMRRHFEIQMVRHKEEEGFYMNKIRQFDKNNAEIESLAPFQLFDFTDLMHFAHGYGQQPVYPFDKYDVAGKQKSAIEILRSLRNMAMHGKNPIGRDMETLIYSISSLQSLSDSLKVFRSEHSNIRKRVRSHPDFIRSVELENRSKLEIIHHHHPKALEYFFGSQ